MFDGDGVTERAVAAGSGEGDTFAFACENNCRSSTIPSHAAIVYVCVTKRASVCVCVP